jgi:Rod binding domain-containing protein
MSDTADAIPASATQLRRLIDLRNQSRGGAAGSASAATANVGELKRLHGAMADFEALYLQQLLQTMRSTVTEGKNGELFAPGPGEKMFREMLDGEYARVMSQRADGLGFKKAMLDNLGRGSAKYRAAAAAVPSGPVHPSRARPVPAQQVIQEKDG